MVDDVTTFRHEIAAILQGATELTPGQRERVRFAVQNRTDPEKVRELLRDTRLAENIGERLIAQLEAAERKIRLHDIRELEAQVLAGLPELP